jgi:hypothetical protein
LLIVGCYNRVRDFFTKRTFMELLGHYQVSVLNYPAEDIKQDFENA